MYQAKRRGTRAWGYALHERDLGLQDGRLLVVLRVQCDLERLDQHPRAAVPRQLEWQAV